jgi:hypothetical protein
MAIATWLTAVAVGWFSSPPVRNEGQLVETPAGAGGQLAQSTWRGQLAQFSEGPRHPASTGPPVRLDAQGQLVDIYDPREGQLVDVIL